MAINLVSLVSQFLTPQLVGSLARVVGVNEAVAQKLAAAAIPTILAALATTAAAPGGAQKLADTVSNSDPDLLSKLTSAIGGGNVGALSEGANSAQRTSWRLRAIEHRRRVEPVRRRSAGRRAVGGRRGRPIRGRHDRSAGSFQLVRRVLDRRDAEQPEERDLGRRCRLKCPRRSAPPAFWRDSAASARPRPRRQARPSPAPRTRPALLQAQPPVARRPPPARAASRCGRSFSSSSLSWRPSGGS